MRPELVRATELLRQNDQAQLNEALGLLQGTVYSFSMKVCGHPQDAEDTAQEVLLRSLPHLAKISDPRAMSVWLYTVAKNRCVRMRRKGAHTPFRVLSLDELMPGDAELQQVLQDSGAGPEARLSRMEQSEMLHTAILDLPPQYRLVVVLHDLEELSTDELAQILSVTPATVRVRLHRARLALRRALAPSELKRGSNHPRVPRSRSRKCKPIFAKLSEYLDGRFNPAQAKEIEKHFATCVLCVAFVEDLRRIVDRCRKIESHCTADVQARLRTLLNEEQHRIASLSSKTFSQMM